MLDAAGRCSTLLDAARQRRVQTRECNMIKTHKQIDNPGADTRRPYFSYRKTAVFFHTVHGPTSKSVLSKSRWLQSGANVNTRRMLLKNCNPVRMVTRRQIAPWTSGTTRWLQSGGNASARGRLPENYNPMRKLPVCRQIANP